MNPRHADYNSATQGQEKPPRKRGRPKGTPKTGGRKAGVKNWTAKDIRDALLGKSEAVETLADIVAGRQLLVSGPTGKAVWRYPTMAERLKGLQLIMDRTVPTLQATELTGKDGAELFPAVTRKPEDTRQMARAIISVLSEAVPDGASVSVAAPDEHVARFKDPDLGRQLMPYTETDDTGSDHG